MSVKKLQPFILTLLCLSPLLGQNDKLRFEHYDGTRGLSENSVNCILQDRTGFLWVATTDGLNKFDGYSFEIFRRVSDDTNTISFTDVQTLYQTRDGIVWIGSLTTGLTRYDPRKASFRGYTNNPKDSLSLADNAVTAMCEDQKGNFWIGSLTGHLQMLDRRTGNFHPFVTSDSSLLDIAGNAILHLYEDSRGRLWAGTRRGLVQIYSDGLPDSMKSHTVWRTVSYPVGSVRKIVEDRHGIFWLASENIGLTRFDPQTSPHNSRSLERTSVQGRVRNLAIDSKGDIWIASDGEGVFRYNPETKALRNFKTDPSDPTTVNSNSFWYAYADRQGIVWFGSYGGGLNKYDPENQKFISYTHIPGNANSLSEKNIWSIWEDRQGIVWIGTDSYGLNRFDPATGKFTVFHHEPGNQASIQSNRVMAVYEDRPGRLWIGTSEGLDLFNRKTNRVQHYLKAFVQCILESSDGQLWVGTLESGLFRLNPRTGAAEHFRPDPTNPAALNSSGIFALHEDSSGNIWVGSLAGLSRYSKLSMKFDNIILHPESTGIVTTEVFCIAPDGTGDLWLATNVGLLRFDPRNNTMNTVTAKDGLANDYIYRVERDQFGNLWMSSNGGLSRFNPETRSVRNFTLSDGLQDNEFNQGASCQGRNNRLYFGGINGFTCFDPSSVSDNPYLPQLVITDFKKLNRSVELDTTISFKKELAISYQDNFISFDYASLSFTRPEKSRYRYILEGNDKDWIDAGTRREATYTNLKGGKYTFRVEASNSDGLWNRTGASIRVIVAPPFWETTWFSVAVVAVVAIGLFSVVKVRVRTLEHRARELESVVNLKTSELRETNHQLKELISFKESMTGMIVHDLKNPLNTIIGLSDGGATPERLEAIHQSGRQMLNLVTNILDVQKFEDAKVVVEPNNHPLLRLIMDALEQVNLLREQKMVHVANAVDRSLFVRVDYEMTVRVLVNLLTNAIKFTPPGSEIALRAEQLNEFIRVSVTDAGGGIPEDKLDRVFDKFGQVEVRKSGLLPSTGLGLTFCKFAVEAHGGAIGVASVVGRGSTFWFTVPRGTQDQDELVVAPRTFERATQLTEEEQQRICTALDALRALRYYEASAIRQILAGIQEQGNGNIASWIRAVESTVYNSDEQGYHRLIGKTTP